MSGSRYYRRVEPEPGDRLRAGLIATALAASVAGVSYYLVSLFLSRERLEPLGSGVTEENGDEGRGGHRTP